MAVWTGVARGQNLQELDRRPGDDAIRIVVADDHPVVRHGLRAMLHMKGMEVVGEARTGAEAIDITRQLRPDVVLMDLRMPEMDGLAATRIIRQEMPQVAVIIITSFETKEYLRLAIEAGAAGYLVKGMSREVLVQAVRMVRQGGSMVDARLLAELTTEPARPNGEAIRRGEGLLSQLTPREMQVLRMLSHGLTNKEIAQQMHYSVGTVKNVVQRIIEKLGVTDRTQAAVVAVRAGLDIEAT
jgi:DNA-binding NarL/FixJ family response regulator